MGSACSSQKQERLSRKERRRRQEEEDAATSALTISSDGENVKPDGTTKQKRKYRCSGVKSGEQFLATSTSSHPDDSNATENGATAPDQNGGGHLSGSTSSNEIANLEVQSLGPLLFRNGKAKYVPVNNSGSGTYEEQHPKIQIQPNKPPKRRKNTILEMAGENDENDDDEDSDSEHDGEIIEFGTLHRSKTRDGDDDDDDEGRSNMLPIPRYSIRSVSSDNTSCHSSGYYSVSRGTRGDRPPSVALTNAQHGGVMTPLLQSPFQSTLDIKRSPAEDNLGDTTGNKDGCGDGRRHTSPLSSNENSRTTSGGLLENSVITPGNAQGYDIQLPKAFEQSREKVTHKQSMFPANCEGDA